MGEMRILAGELKGQRIGPLPDKIFLRPISVATKKSLFDILKNRIFDSLFLDLFAGSGAVGLEALSRGAKKVVFVDSNPLCQKWIQKTLVKICGHHVSRPEVYCSDVLAGLGWLNRKFDLIFSGAPYKDVNKKALFFVQNVLKIVHQDQIIHPEGWFIAQHHCKETFQTDNNWNFFRQEYYGDTTLSFFSYGSKNP